MAQHFNTRQRNNLLTGKKLAAEVPASAPNLRAFVEIWAHAADREWGGVSRFLNADTSNLRFDLWKYEIDRSYYETDGWDPDHFTHGEVREKGFTSLEEFQRILCKYVDDLAAFDNDFRVDTPH